MTELPFAEDLDARTATRSVDDPGCGSGPTLWYTFTPESAGRFEVSAYGFEWSSRIGIYADTPADENELACTSPGYGNSPRFEATSGTTYYVLFAYDLSFATGGDMHLGVRQVPRPATNDDVGNAVVVDPLPFESRADVRDTEFQAIDDPATSCGLSLRTVWYAFTAPRDRRVVASTTGSDYPTAISVYTGSPGNFPLLQCDQGNVNGGAAVSFTGQKGTTYYLMVSAWDYTTGDLVFSMPLPNALSLTATRGTITYGDSVKLKGHLEAFDDSANHELTIYATPHGGNRVPVTTTHVNASGDYGVAVKPKKKTVYEVEWAGDDNYPAIVSHPRTVSVRALVTTRLYGWYGRSGSTFLYHAGERVRLVGSVAPNHAGMKLYFFFEAHVRGSWRDAGSATFKLNKDSKIFVIVSGLPNGMPFRVRSVFFGDADHDRGRSPLIYFRVG